MKRVIVYFVLLIVTLPVFAQQTIRIDEYNKNEVQTVFKKDKRDGFYFGSTLGYSPIDKTNSVTASGRMGWIMDRWFAFGLSGTAFVNNIDKYSYSYINNRDLVFLAGGYGGLFIEPILMPLKPVHLSFPIVLGGGGAFSFSDYYYTSTDGISESAFFVVEPGIELEVNFTRWMRVGIFATYRYTSDLHIESVSKGALRNYSTGLSLKLGWF